MKAKNAIILAVIVATSTFVGCSGKEEHGLDSEGTVISDTTDVIESTDNANSTDDIDGSDKSSVSGETVTSDSADASAEATSSALPEEQEKPKNPNDTVLTIEDGVVVDCSIDALGELTIPDGVTSIGEKAFDDCANITSITIPDSVTSIGDWAFDGCTNLTSITIPDSVTSIGYNAFYETAWLDNCDDDMIIAGNGILLKYNGSEEIVVIPDGVTVINDYAFEYNTTLIGVSMPSSVITVGDMSFYGCTSLAALELSENITEINECVFESMGYNHNEAYGISYRGNTYLRSVEDVCKAICYNEDGLFIKDNVLIDCLNDTEGMVTVPDNVVAIGDTAFRNCKKLTNIIMHMNIESVGMLPFSGCERLASIVVPDCVTCIGQNYFRNCKSLSSVVLPESITRIEFYAFSGCDSLVSIVIPDRVFSISQAFDGCKNLRSITYKGETYNFNDVYELYDIFRDIS